MINKEGRYEMSRYVFRLRRGTKTTDANGNIIRDDWATYEDKPDHIKPLEGELVLEYDNGIPRLKIGDGIREFSALPYMSVDSFVLPTSASITLLPDAWQPVLDTVTNEPVVKRYYQPVTVNNAIVTSNSKIDLQPSPEQLAVFAQNDVTFTAINAEGNVRVCVVGEKPMGTYIINATVTEVTENA